MNESTDEQILLILGTQQIRKRKIYIPPDVFDEGEFRVTTQKYTPLLDVTSITSQTHFNPRERRNVRESWKNIIKRHL